ncbi:biopolymer transporter ExbD [Shewanella glacialipiscicola]|uniref:ExbD/TolR family protein n=1 Tax=Shewanella glacialipiscicola TaxID=614069 RepID=UPI0021D944AA|nr:biopolymer transporter ExbD [Shewanella glacialipiscicola]MCU7995379.1 biopolymer transporter ExbD [Shewanella glacialipiscicola]MCU8025587.1 biopolymer transporter ExbD [Shewanella glacialipiscicola]
MISTDKFSLSHNGISSPEQLPSVDLTALIDIIFIVLVFLLLTANSQLLSLPVAVPQSPSSAITAVKNQPSIAINIMATAPYWAIDGEQFMDLARFTTVLIQRFQAMPEATVVIAADKAAPVEPLMQLLALLQTQSISQTQILMEH